MSPFPTLPFCMKISKQIKEIFVFCGCLDHLHFWEIFASFKIVSDVSRQNLFMNFVDLTRLTHLPWLILQPSVASTTIFYESSIKPLAPSMDHIHREKFSWISAKKFLNNDIYIRLSAITINYHDGNSCYNLLLSRAFSVGIPLTVGFTPQLVVVSGLSVAIPLMVGFRPQLVVV
jgi:hypothetical protein